MKRLLRLHNGRCFAWSYKRKEDTIRKQVTTIKKDEGTGQEDEKDKEDTTDKDTEERSDQKSDKDQDSDVSFQEDADEEIDATENEEDWIAYIKRSTKEAEEHMEKPKNMLDWNTQKIEVANGTKNHFPTWKKMDQKSFRVASWIGQKH